MTPRSSSSALSCASLLKAPRTLKENTWAMDVCQVHVSMKSAFVGAMSAAVSSSALSCASLFKALRPPKKNTYAACHSLMAACAQLLKVALCQPVHILPGHCGEQVCYYSQQGRLQECRSTTKDAYMQLKVAYTFVWYLRSRTMTMSVVICSPFAGLPA